MSKSDWSVTAALLLALASIVVTRALKAFSVAEVLALLAFLSGLTLWWLNRDSADPAKKPWPQRLIIAGSVVGLSGVMVKLVFVALGIGTGDHDMANHDASPNPLLQHIHHLFFNVGFVLFLVAAAGMLVRRLRRGN